MLPGSAPCLSVFCSWAMTTSMTVPADSYRSDCRRLFSGRLLLIHPGLAEPERMMDYACADLDLRMLSSASDSVGDLESPLYEQMLSLLLDVTRPEISPEDAVEDLIILAKQEVPCADMEEVLSSLLICQVTPEMRRALRELSSRVPRWLTLGTSRVQ